MSGYCYLIHQREWKNANKPYYKFGMTTRQLHKRLAEYPIDSSVIIAMCVDDAKACEDMLKMEFKKRFIQCRRYGTETFEGDESMMVEVFKDVCDMFNEKHGCCNEDIKEEATYDIQTMLIDLFSNL